MTAEPQLLSRAYRALMTGFVRHGRALHYTELGEILGLASDQARQAQKDLVASGLPIWEHPDTDLIVAMTPFSSLPTQYRISVNGQQASSIAVPASSLITSCARGTCGPASSRRSGSSERAISLRTGSGAVIATTTSKSSGDRRGRRAVLVTRAALSYDERAHGV